MVATWKLGNHLSIRLKTQGNQDKPASVVFESETVLCTVMSVNKELGMAGHEKD